MRISDKRLLWARQGEEAEAGRAGERDNLGRLARERPGRCWKQGDQGKEVATVTAEDDQERPGYRSVKEVTVRSVVRRTASSSGTEAK